MRYSTWPLMFFGCLDSYIPFDIKMDCCIIHVMKIITQLPVSIFKEGRYFVAYTPALDLSTSGKSYEEAKSRFREIVSIFFDELVKRGTLEEILTGLGWQKIKRQWEPPLIVSQELEKISLPVS